MQAMEETLTRFKIMTYNGKILGTAPHPRNICQTIRLLTRIRTTYQDEVYAVTLPILVPLIWAKDNDPEQWWSINDYYILSTTFHHEVEIFSKDFSHKKEEEDNPFTPLRKSTPHLSVSGPVSP
jgi:hypothetical protein